ncbi:hypothetical protein, partial [Pseudomonas nitroreducens]|uniref:hypothetical protein n=1 Tax=Pseudomonas nitroreducens TaxID=46680 RepID=UPI0028AC4636
MSRFDLHRKKPAACWHAAGLEPRSHFHSSPAYETHIFDFRFYCKKSEIYAETTSYALNRPGFPRHFPSSGNSVS